MFHGNQNDPYLNALHAVADAVHAAGAVQEHKELMARYGAQARGFIIHYSTSKVQPTGVKCHYVSKGAAERAVAKLNARRGGSMFPSTMFTVTEAREYYRSMRLVVQKNIQGGKLFLEREDTPYYCSPSSETYHSA